MSNNTQRNVWFRAVSAGAMVFGLMTLKEGGSVLFIDGAARAAAGAYVPWVLWFNFLAGLAYVVAGVGLWQQRRWAARLALAIAAATALVFVAFGVHVLAGGAYEQRTVLALALRTLLWAAIAGFAWRRLLRAAAQQRG